MGFPIFADQVHVVAGFQDQTGAAIAGDWVNLEGYGGCLILMHEMRGADATPTVIRVDKARDVSGTNQSPGITMKNFWYSQDRASVTGDVGATAAATVGATDAWTKGTAATSFSGSVTQSVGQWVQIDVNADDLPDSTYDDYNSIQLQVVSSNAAHYLSAWYILYNPKSARNVADQPTALTD